jgi:hypothetical protein
VYASAASNVVCVWVCVCGPRQSERWEELAYFARTPGPRNPSHTRISPSRGHRCPCWSTPRTHELSLVTWECRSTLGRSGTCLAVRRARVESITHRALQHTPHKPQERPLLINQQSHEIENDEARRAAPDRGTTAERTFGAIRRSVRCQVVGTTPVVVALARALAHIADAVPAALIQVEARRGRRDRHEQHRHSHRTLNRH